MSLGHLMPSIPVIRFSWAHRWTEKTCAILYNKPSIIAFVTFLMTISFDDERTTHAKYYWLPPFQAVSRGHHGDQSWCSHYCCSSRSICCTTSRIKHPVSSQLAPRCWPQYDVHKTRQSQDVSCGGHHWRPLGCECWSKRTCSGWNHHPQWRMRKHMVGTGSRKSSTNRQQLGSNKLGDHVIVQSHQFGILRSDAMLFNNDNRLLKGKTGGCVIDRQPKAQRIFNGHRICHITFIELEEPHYVRLRDGLIIPIRSIIVKVEVKVPN